MQKPRRSHSILPKLSLTPKSGAALVAVLVCLAGAGYLAAKTVYSFAATAPTVIICSHGTVNGVVCLNRYRGTTGPNAGVVGYFGTYDLNERFQFQSLPGLCGGYVTSTCPFSTAALNSRYQGDEIVQFRDYGTGLCVGNDVFDASKTAEEACNNPYTGSGGGNGTVFVHNLPGHGGTPDYTESRYWSNRYGSPAWLCSADGYPSDPRQLLTNSRTDFGGDCQWHYVWK